MKNIVILLAFLSVPLAACGAQPTQSQLTTTGDLAAKSGAPGHVAPVSDDDDDTPAKVNEDRFTLIPGDVLQVTVWKEEGMDREILVLPDGTITFPLIGTVAAKGLTPRQLQSSIKSKLKPFIPDASVNVMVKAPLGHTVSVLGQVTKPGEIVLSRQIDVMEAISQVGGLTAYANTSHITVLRYVNGKKTSIDFPYEDVARGNHLEEDITLKPGDVVVVPTAGLF